MNKFVWLPLLSLASLLPAGAQSRRVEPVSANPQRRMALVIGNKDYALQPLLNPANDAADLARSLRDLGFDTRLFTNLDRVALDRAVRDYAAAVQPGDTALFFFSGHGMEVEGQNYLLPVDFAAQTEEEVKYQALPATLVQERLQARGARAVILIIDACRNNPYRSWQKGAGGGLAGMSGKGVYVAFAAAPGSTADDNRAERNGRFTKHLLNSIQEPGLTIDEVFNQVRERVASETDGKQVPFSNSGLIGRFVFRDAAAERARLEREIQDLERQAAEAQQRKDEQKRAEMERQAAAARERLKLQPSAGPAPAAPPPADDLEKLRQRRDAERARVSDLGGPAMTLQAARLEVASLEKKVADIRAEVNAAKETALREANPEKGQFETTAQYEARRQQADVQRAKLAAQFEGEFDVEAKPYRDRIASLKTASYPAPALKLAWKTYDADRSRLTMTVDTEDVTFSVEPSKAEILYMRRDRLTAETSYDGEPVLLDPDTGAMFGRARAPRVNSKDGLAYVWIPIGTFTMGCSPEDSECYDDERPTHQVSITSGFWMGQTPVTQEAYQRVTGTNPSHFKGPKLPVETVNWTDARNFCEQAGMRLPTEAEWEYAARAGTTGSRYDEIDKIAWYQANSGGRTHEVKQKQPNAWDLYDMLGNVWQWRADWYAEGQTRTLRGGSWDNVPSNVRVSDRVRYAPDYRVNSLGVRCVGN